MFVTRNGTQERVGAYCNKWSSQIRPAFCYLHGGLAAYNCPGASRSSRGEFYITRDPAVCLDSEEEGSGEFLQGALTQSWVGYFMYVGWGLVQNYPKS